LPGGNLLRGDAKLAACLASRVERKSSPEIGEEKPTGRKNSIFQKGRIFENADRQVIRFLNHVKKITRISSD